MVGTGHEKPIVVATCLTEFHANVIAEALHAEGIAAETVGGIVGGMRAEAPGTVQVLVKAEDGSRAEAVVEAMKQANREIDWSEVDVGEPPEGA